MLGYVLEEFVHWLAFLYLAGGYNIVQQGNHPIGLPQLLNQPLLRLRNPQIHSQPPINPLQLIINSNRARANPPKPNNNIPKLSPIINPLHLDAAGLRYDIYLL